MSERPGRLPHPCIGRRCGHAPEAHLRTPELESYGETVLWCSDCRRHEVRRPMRIWGARRPKVAFDRPVPSRAG